MTKGKAKYPYSKIEDLSVLGRYEAHASPSGEIAGVIFTDNNTIVHRFTGETAWSDAIRLAEDLNIKDNRK